MAYKYNPLPPQFNRASGGGSGGPINTINNEPPVANNFNITSADGTLNVVSTVGNVDLSVSGVYGVYRSISFADSPYSILVTDDFISVDTSGGAISVILPATGTANQSWIVKDRTGNANTNNITVTAAGGFTVDTQVSYVIEGNYESSNFLFHGTNFETF